MVTCSKISATTSTLARAAAVRRDGARRELLFRQRDNAALSGKRIDLCTYSGVPQLTAMRASLCRPALPNSRFATATGIYINLTGIMTVH